MKEGERGEGDGGAGVRSWFAFLGVRSRIASRRVASHRIASRVIASHLVVQFFCIFLSSRVWGRIRMDYLGMFGLGARGTERDVLFGGWMARKEGWREGGRKEASHLLAHD